ncbi:hypothetical protein J6590_062518 [Homalodisca vitripennis]|nr:hypothetical protein J6590_062518 [Homalodisca vitripennis]
MNWNSTPTNTSILIRAIPPREHPPHIKSPVAARRNATSISSSMGEYQLKNTRPTQKRIVLEHYNLGFKRPAQKRIVLEHYNLGFKRHTQKRIVLDPYNLGFKRHTQKRIVFNH